MNPEIIEQIPATLTYDDGGKAVPYRDHPFVKDAPDLPTFVKMAVDAHKEVGSRIPIKVDKNNVVEVEKWRKDHLPRLYDAGVVARPPASPDEYNDVVVKPETLPDGFGWNEELTKEFKTIAHKHGIPKSAIPDLLALHQKTIQGVSEVLKTTEESATAALKVEYGDKYEERREAAMRLVDYVIKTPEEVEFFDRTKLGNSPTLLGMFMRLAPLAQADSSFFANQPGGGGGGSAMTHEQIMAEHSKVMNDKTHPHHAGYWKNDKAAMDYVDSLYQKGPSAGKKVEIT